MKPLVGPFPVCLGPPQLFPINCRCQEVEQAFTDMQKGNKDAMKTYNEVQVGQLTKLIEVTRTELPKSERQKVMNMITIDAHSRDMVQVRINRSA